MKELKEEERHRRRRPHSPETVSVKKERVSPPPRPHRARPSSSPGSSGGESLPAQYRGRSRSPIKKKKSNVKRSKSPRRRNRSDSRSPPPVPVKIKQEKEKHTRRTHDDKQPRERWEKDDRRNSHRDHAGIRGHHNHSRHRERDREEQHLREQREEREFHNERRRERRQRQEQGGEIENPESDNTEGQAKEKEKPNFGLSGALLEDTNTFRGVVIKYSEPPEARVPKKRWRLYPFKNDEALPVMYIHRQSAYLLGRQRRIADIPIDHPSCSKQHAVLQYRVAAFKRTDGTPGRRVRPYIIDLGSGNGTYLNNQRIEAQRYYELKEKDVLKFGFSSREYVVLHEFSDTSEVDKPQEDEDEYEEDEGTDS